MSMSICFILFLFFFFHTDTRNTTRDCDFELNFIVILVYKLIAGSCGILMRRQFATLMGDQWKFRGGNKVVIIGRKIKENLGHVSRIKRRTSSIRNGRRQHLFIKLEDFCYARQYYLSRRRDAKVSDYSHVKSMYYYDLFLVFIIWA